MTSDSIGPSPETGDSTLVIPAGTTPTARFPDRWASPAPADLTGQLPGYEVEHLLGAGGMGAVYLARQPALDRQVAIKVLPAELGGQEEFAGRFLREARALAKLDAPGIVRIIEFGRTEAGLLYYTMDYVVGGDLRTVLREHGPLPPARAVPVMVEVCAALACAHRAGILHRDIKPANILLTRDGRVKVADFGLARMMETGRDFGTTVPGIVMGTPDYMAPEQRAGEASGQSDLYAAGVLLYELLTGSLPRGAWEPPSSLIRPADATVRRLDAVVRRALQEDPAARFRSAEEMKTALETAAGAGPAPTPPAPRFSAWLIAGLLLAGCAWLAGRSRIGADIAVHVRSGITGFAAPVPLAVSERIVIGDISRLKPRTVSSASGEVNATPRDRLLGMVTAIAEARPLAIGIDIDFSPHEDFPDQPYTPDDPDFFRELLLLKKRSGVPVFAGVWRQDSAGSARWLGRPEFASLAAGLGIARDEDRPVERLPAHFTAESDGSRLPSMSFALAGAGGMPEPEPDSGSLWRRREIIPAGAISVQEYHASFASLESLLARRVTTSSADEITGLREQLRGRLVLLSDADLSQRADPFSIPDRRNEPVPGGYVHACGAATLISGLPAVPTDRGRMVLGTLFVALLAGCRALPGWWLGRRSRAINVPLVNRISRIALTIAVLAGAAAFMRAVRLVWTDAVYLSMALIVLPPLAARIAGLMRAASTVCRKVLYSSP